MMARRRKRRDYRRKTNGDQRRFLRRHATSIGIALSVLAIVVGIVQLWPAVVSNRVLQNPILQVSDLKVTTKKGVTATDFDTGTEVGKEHC